MKKRIIGLLIVVVISFVQFSVGQSIDNTFGSEGKAVVDINNQLQFANTIKIQPDGKILLSGHNVSPVEYIIIRLTENGLLDNSFNGNGKLVFNVTGGSNGGGSHTMILQSDNKIVVGGEDYDGIEIGSVLVRLNSDGTFDNTFGVNGFVRFNVCPSSEAVRSINILADNKILVVGDYYNGSTDELYLARFNADGTFDTSFDTDGIITLPGNTKNILTVFPSDGKIVIASRAAIIRLNADGSIDNSFGTNGQVDITEIDISAITILNSNKIAIAGTKSLGMLAVGIIGLDGNFDVSFGVNGVSAFTPNGLEANVSEFNSITEDVTSNKLIVGGYSLHVFSQRKYVILVELSSDGTLENYTTLFEGGISSAISSIVIQSDRKIVVGGTVDISNNTDLAVYRINADFDTYVTDITNLSLNNMVKFNLFPNPASQTINIHSSNTIENIRVLDVLGNEVLNTAVDGNTQFDISTLPKGLYNFVIKTDKGTGMKKVSVQ